nr:MAG TPA: hypothetical protein [Caudoviricetes sp.]
MEKDEILEKSRKENKNKDLADMDVASQAGNIAGRVGACVCCLVSVIFHWFTDTFLCSPWIIYFSILGTHYLVKYNKTKNKSDLFLSVVYFVMCLLALIFFIVRLWEVKE